MSLKITCRLNPAVLFLCVATNATAESDNVSMTSEEQFRLGRKAMEDGDCHAALPLLRESHAAKPGLGKLLNIAICEEQIGLFATAQKHFKELQLQIPAIDDRRPIIEEHLASVAPRVPYLRILLGSNAPTETHVELDGAELAASDIGSNLALDPGEHHMVGKAPGKSARLYRITAEKGKRLAITITFEEPPTRQSRVTQRSIVPIFGLSGAAIASIGGGVILWAQRNSKQAEAVELRTNVLAANQSCVADAKNFANELCPHLASTTLEGDTFATGSAIAFTAGGLFAAAAVTYYLWRPVKADSKNAVLNLMPIMESSVSGTRGAVLQGRF